LITWNSDFWYKSSLPNEHDWAFVENCLPTVEDLIGCRNGGKYHQCDSGPFAGLHKAFSEFGEHYCKMGRKLPLVWAEQSLDNASTDIRNSQAF
jgi:hypothetical protein